MTVTEFRKELERLEAEGYGAHKIYANTLDEAFRLSASATVLECCEMCADFGGTCGLDRSPRCLGTPIPIILFAFDESEHPWYSELERFASNVTVLSGFEP